MKQSGCRTKVSSGHHIPNEYQLSNMAHQTLKRSNVQACFIGPKVKSGRTTRTLSLVCVVRKKLAPKDLHKKQDLIPKVWKWRCGRQAFRELTTDVVELSGKFQHAASVWGPGDIAGGEPFATIGYAMEHPEYGDLVTTAGHFILGRAGSVTYPPGTAPVVTLRNADGSGTARGRLVKAVCDDLRDYALVIPEGVSPCQNLFLDQYLIRQPYRPSTDNLLRPVRVLTGDGIRNATLRGLEGVIQVDQSRTMHNLLITNYATYPGDSGACLIDEFDRTIGLLVGGFSIEQITYSVFMPADVPLWSEGGMFL